MNRLAVLLLLLASGTAYPSVDVTGARSGCTILFRAGEPEITRLEEGWFPAFEGLGTAVEPGMILTPFQRVFIPVPGGSGPVLSAEVLSLSGFEAPAEAPLRAPLITGSGLETVQTDAPPVEGPRSHVVLSGLRSLAGYTFAVVDIYPWLGGTDGTYASSVRVEVSWRASRGGTLRPGGPAERLSPWGLPFHRNPPARAESPFWGLPWARISLTQGGGCEISCEELEQAGCGVSGAPSQTLRLFTGPGQQFQLDVPEEEHLLEEVAFEVLDGGDGSFDPGDRLRFVARALERWVPQGTLPVYQRHRWASHNVYWLTWGGEPGRRAPELASPPDGSPSWGASYTRDFLVEQNLLWKPEIETTHGWVWAGVAPGASLGCPYSLGVTPAGAGTVRVRMVSDESGVKYVRILLGGQLIAEDTWYGAGTRVVTIPGVSAPASGQFTIENSSSSDEQFFVDNIHIRIPVGAGSSSGAFLLPGVERQGRFEMTIGPAPSGTALYLLDDFHTPVLLTGWEPVASGASFSAEVGPETHLIAVQPGQWMSPDSIAPASPGRLVATVTGGDRLLVVPEVLSDDLWGLLALYGERGIDCVTATTREIFDEFGQGVPDPGAIRSAVRWALDSWSEPAGGVMLVGDGHYDALGRTTTAPVMIFPWSGLGYSDPLTDDSYVMVHAGSDLPELPVSRLPVQTGSELLTCTAKLAAVESGASGGEWTNRILFVADDEWSGYSQNETEHTVNCEIIAETVVPRSVERVKFYLIEYPWPSTVYHPEKPEAREDLVAELSRGHAAVLYIGHGSANQIAHEVILLGSDIQLLSNQGRLPVMFWATCDVGRFENPGEDAIGEKTVLHPAGGALASVAATRGTYGPANYLLSRSFFDSLYTDPALGLGTSLWLAKLSAGQYVTNSRYYVLFGDLDAGMPRPDGSMEIDVPMQTLTAGEINHVAGTAGLPSGVAFLELRESSARTTYTCLGGAEIDYLRYGGVAFRGGATISGGAFELDCLVPLQAVTGSFGRAGGYAPGPSTVGAGGADPLDVVEGTPPGGDFHGPEVEMWIAGYQGVEEPEVSGDLQLEASLSDTSGICFLGGPGRQLTLFVDAQGTDVGDWFSYLLGSTTEGQLSYPVGELTQGPHRLILWSFDGAGNSSRDTLDVQVRSQGEMSISDAFVYPNPGSGQRCFSFLLSEDASVSISIHTVAGRCIRRIDAQCSQGYNQVLWDGFDADGDQPATGAYPFVVSATSTGASSFESDAVFSGVLAVIR